MEPLRSIAYQEVFSLPLIVYGGIFTLLCFTATAAIGFLTIKKIRRFPLSWHTNLAYLSIILGILHGIIGILVNI